MAASPTSSYQVSLDLAGFAQGFAHISLLTQLRHPIKVDSLQSMSHQTLSPIYYPAPYSSSMLVSQLAEEEQIQIAKRIGLIQHLPIGIYDGGGSSKKSRECVICMVEFSKGDSIRFLPCLHTYHVHCIDDWLMRSFICPSCMEPVDVALLNTSENVIY